MRKFFPLPTLILGLLVLGGPDLAWSEEINFEEIIASNDAAVVLSDEYAALGAQFVGADGSIWHGVTDGDPGGFELNGTNGPSFLGFDGGTFAMDLQFDAPVRDFRLDLARGAGGNFHFFFLLMGLRDGELVDLVGATFGSVGEWKELALTEEIDSVSWMSFGDFRYGVDNLRWEGTMASVVTVEIDIMPGSEHNPVRLGRSGVVPVALLGAEDLDVMDVDPDSLSLGPDMAPLAHHKGPHMMDVDDDGLLDLLAHFRVVEAGMGYEDVMTCLGGELLDGTPLEGCDAVIAVGTPRR